MQTTEDNPNDAPIVDDEVPTGQKPPQPLPRETTTSLKRGREASVDLLASETTSAAHIAAKKNRLEEDAPEHSSETDDDAGSQTAADASPAKEGRTVGEVRRKVQEMNWKEGEQKAEPSEGVAKSEKGASSATTVPTSTAGESAKNPADVSTTSDDAEEPDWVKVDKAAAAGAVDKSDAAAGKVEKPESSVSDDAAQESDTPSLKRKAKEDVAGDAVAAVEEKKRKSTSPSPGDASSKAEAGATAASSVATEPPKKPAATFGSFSTKASPFASLGGSSKSVFGASSSSPFAAAAAKPSAFASAASKPATESSAAAPKPSGTSAFATSGFGSYSTASSPFAAKRKPEDTANEAGTSATFGEILKEKGDQEEEDTKLHLDKQEVPTGEEDEETMFQTRAKLFTMEEEGAWKERGVGLLKVNRRRTDACGARLVMRADGVLRVILNANLYVGMTCKEDGKHVRTTIFEGPQRRFITIRTANPKAASELAAVIHEHIPLESKAASKSPQPKDDSEV